MIKYGVVIISANWTDYVDASDGFMARFLDDVQYLTSKGKRIVLIGKVPPMDSYDRYCQEKALTFPIVECPNKIFPVSEQIKQINSELKAIADETEMVEYFDANSYICPDELCSLLDEKGVPKYYDASHLTLDYSWHLEDLIVKREGVPTPFYSLGNSHGS